MILYGAWRKQTEQNADFHPWRRKPCATRLPDMQLHWRQIDRGLTGALGLIAPLNCVFCSAAAGGRCCDRCKALIRKNSIACRHCASPMQSLPAGLCGRCQADEPPFAVALAPLLYEFPVDAAIKACKFRRQLFYLPVFGDFLLTAFEKHFTDVDALVAVPLHRWRHAFRGFNQAEELCKFLRRRTGLPIVANVRRPRATATQSGLTFDERRQNVRHAFSVRGRLRSRRPLIVDDVMTTGETCKELAKLLLAKGAEKVSVLTIARARPVG